MGHNSARIADLWLYKELLNSVGRDGLDGADVQTLAGVVGYAAEEVAPALSRIALTFQQYTVHDLQHSCNLIRLMGEFIPVTTLRLLNALELGLLLLAALFHDTGMVVSDQEKGATLQLPVFQRFRNLHNDRLLAIEQARSLGNELRARAIEDSLLAEYYRRHHAQRARIWIAKVLATGFSFRGVDLIEDLGDLCESHAWSFEAPVDPRGRSRAVSTLPDDRRIGNVPLNLQYLACCLRLADILDFDRSRTPLAILDLIDFTEAKSWEEWNKHLSIEGWSVTETEVRFEARCDHPAYYVAVHQFLDEVDRELQQSCYLIAQKPAGVADRYRLLLPPIVDRRRIRMRDDSYVAGGFRFSLEYEEILRLLMDQSLYPDPSLFLRELLQNALDACSRKKALASESGYTSAYQPRIVIWDHSRDASAPRIVVQDNGVGMSLAVVEQYFLRVGRSYYKSAEFATERLRLERAGIEIDVSSQFGIGILSCFLVGDHFEVCTYQFGYDPLRIEVQGPTRYFVIQRLERPPEAEFPVVAATDAADGPPMRTGTRITVWLRPRVDLSVAATVAAFAVNCDYQVQIYEASESRSRLIEPNAWEHMTPTEAMRRMRHNSQYHSWPRLSVEASAICEILEGFQIPFNKWSFSSHIRGKSFLWLIRGEGHSRPSRGYLSIRNTLSLVGPAHFVEEFDAKEHIHYELADMLAARSFDAPPIYPSEDYDFDDCRQFSDREQLALATRYRSKSWLPWHSNASLILRSLCNGSLEWTKYELEFNSSFRNPFYQAYPEIALHSIRLPGGVVRFEPAVPRMALFGEPDVAGTFFLDARGPTVPAPSANRLYMGEAEGRRLLAPCYRAALRFACDLAAAFEADDDWRQWVRCFVMSSIAYELSDLEYLERHFRYRVALRSEIATFSRADLERHHGKKLRLCGYRPDDEGLVRDDLMTALLVKVAKVVYEKKEESEYVELP